MITGIITDAGTVTVNGVQKTGFFVECSGMDIREIDNQGMFKNSVIVMSGMPTFMDRRSAGRAEGPSFSRLPEAVKT